MEWPHGAGIFCFPHPALHGPRAERSPLLADFKQNWAMTIAGFQNLLRRSVLHSLPWPCYAHTFPMAWLLFFKLSDCALRKTANADPTLLQGIHLHHFCWFHLHSHQRLFLRLWQKRKWKPPRPWSKLRFKLGSLNYPNKTTHTKPPPTNGSPTNFSSSCH